MQKIPLRETLVVEGKYDKQKLSRLFDTWIVAVGGFRIFQDKALLAMLRRAARETGLIVLTDADGAGLVIRNYLQSAIGSEGIKHAYTPQVPGRERRKRVPGKEGLLGVEGIDDEVLVQCILNAAPQQQSEAKDPLSRMDLYDLGLMGREDSKRRRQALLAHCGLPSYLSTNAMLDALHCLYGRQALAEVCETLFKGGEQA